MNLESLLYGFLFAFTAIVYYRVRKKWLNKKRQSNELDNYSRYVGTVKDWAIIVFLILCSVVFMLKGMFDF